MSQKKNDSLQIATYSGLFILLYSGGFVGVKLGFPYAHPLIFLILRFVVSAVLLCVLSFITKAKWPSSWKQTMHIAVAGLFLMGLVSIGTWTSIDMGVPPAVSALILALQPLAVALISTVFQKKHISPLQWIGMLFGLIGVLLVVWDKASFDMHYLTGILFSFLGLIGLTVGNLYQKQFCANMNIFTGGVIQCVSSGIICFILALLFEPFRVIWSEQFIFALFFMSVVVSIGALSFLYILLRKGETHKVASLFYLIPAVTAVMSYFAFGTVLTPVELLGMFIAMIGVGLVNIKFKKIKGNLEELTS
jgi:drug/metabolite transporter (DMT)-like permease